MYTFEDSLKWWQAPQPLLNNKVPEDMVEAGEGKQVLLVLKAMSDGAYI